MTDGYVHEEDDGRGFTTSFDTEVKAKERAERKFAEELFNPGAEVAERWISLKLGFRSFGTAAQVRETAERVRRMLSVELHQDVAIEGMEQGSCDDSVEAPE